jgi:hypothetical protein
VLTSATLLAICATSSKSEEGSPPKPAGTDIPSPAATDAGKETPAVVLDDQRVESLLGREVASASGEQLGRIVDLLVAKDGTLRAAVIDFGGFLGVGTRKVAVAWTSLTFSDQGPVLDMTTDELRVTPEYRVGEPVVVVGMPSQRIARPPPDASAQPK